MSPNISDTKMWNSISDTNEIESIIEQSETRAQLIYKHSPSCSVSFLSKQDLDANLEKLSEVADLHMLNVISQRDISNAIASELRVRHESPQVLLLKDGEVIWDGSHWQVNADEIQSQLNG